MNFKRRPNSVFVDVELPKSVKQIQKAKNSRARVDRCRSRYDDG